MRNLKGSNILVAVIAVIVACGLMLGPLTGSAIANEKSETYFVSNWENERHDLAREIIVKWLIDGVKGEDQADWRMPDANGVYPAPPHTSDGHTWHHPDQQLLAIISDGGIMPNSAMPGFGEQLSADEMEAILAYIKTFWDDDARKYQEQVTDQYLGSTD